jgi:hypothetical protein
MFKGHTNNSHPFFDSYDKETNQIFNDSDQSNFFEIFSNLNIIEKEKMLKGESPELISEIESYSGNISTSQLKNIDYSKFSNHVFFDSAIHKVKYSFEESIKFPYDSNELEYLTYISNLDGYTKYVFENLYPKYVGHLKFDGNSKVVIKDKNGYLLNDYKGIPTSGKLSPKNESGYTFSFHVKSPTDDSFVNVNNARVRQTVFKKVYLADGSDLIEEGYFCYFENIVNNTEECYINFGIKYAGIDNCFIKKTKIKKDTLMYINIVVKSKKDNIDIEFYINSKINNSFSDTSTLTFKLFSEEFENENVEFVLGSGENNIIKINSNDTSLGDFTSSIDEFIFLNKVRSVSEIKLNRDRNIFKSNSLMLYLKFNEIGGQHQNSALIIDSSGKKLHGVLKNKNNSIILNTTNFKINESFLKQEDLIRNPIILGSVDKVRETRDALVASAKAFDSGNSNIIFNLIPSHYFTNSSNFERKADYISSEFIENISTDYIEIGESDSTENTHLTQILLIWARFFDQLKLYVDSISGMFNLDYDSINREEFVNSQMMLLCKIYGFDFTEIDLNKTRSKNERKNIVFDDITEEIGLVKLQNLLWKKILVNSQDIIRSKGTHHSINSFINALGFDLKKYIDIEEKSNRNYIDSINNYNIIFNEIKSLNFSNFYSESITFDPTQNNIVQNNPLLVIENIKSIDSNTERDGIHNEGSVEIFFDFNKNIYIQSLDKKQNPYKTHQIISQFVTEFENYELCFCILYAKFKNSESKFFDLILETSPIHDVTLGSTLLQRKKNTIIKNINAYDISHYVCLSFEKLNDKLKIFIKHNSIGDVEKENIILTSSITFDLSQNFDLNQNNKLFFEDKFNIFVGNKKYDKPQLFNDFLVDNPSSFEGNIYNIKLWKKSLSDIECLRHSQDILNISEEKLNFSSSNLISNFMFNSIENNIEQGSNEFFASSPEYYFRSIDLDSLGNELNSCKVVANFSNEDSIKNIFTIKKIQRKAYSCNIDKIANNSHNRVRILSYDNKENKSANENYEVYPLHETPLEYESYKTDNLSVSVSSSKIINEAIERLVNNIENITDIISSNTHIYQYSYFEIDSLRKEFFNVYDDKNLINYDNLNNIFKYFDNIMNSVLFSLVPNGINFQGFNLVYESHILERAKYQYKNKDSTISIQDASYYDQTNFNPCTRIDKRNMSYLKSRKFTLN